MTTPSSQGSGHDPSSHRSWLVRQARRLVGKDLRKIVDAEDLVQSTLREAWMRRGTTQFEHEGQRRAWLSKVLRHKAVRWVRGPAPTEVSSAVFRAARSREESPSAWLQAHEQPADLQAHMRQLDERTQHVLRLRFVEQLPFAEIATLTSISEVHARMIFSRGIRDLQQRAGVVPDYENRR